MFRYVRDIVQKKAPVTSGAKKKREHHTTIGTTTAHPGENNGNMNSRYSASHRSDI